MTETNLLKEIKKDAARIQQWTDHVTDEEFVNTELLHYGVARVLDQIGLKCSDLFEQNPSIVSSFPEIEYWSQMDEAITRSPTQTPQFIADVVFTQIPRLLERMEMIAPDVAG